MGVNIANKADKTIDKADKTIDKADKTIDKADNKVENNPTFVEILIGQIADLGSDRRLAREVNGFIRYQLSGLSRGLIDCEVAAKGFGTPEADQFVAEIATAINAVAKKTEDRDTAALLRRFAKVLETDYACVRSAALRRAR